MPTPTSLSSQLESVSYLGTPDFRLENRMCWKRARNSTCERFHLFLLLQGYSHPETKKMGKKGRRAREESSPKCVDFKNLTSTITSWNKNVCEQRLSHLGNHGKIPPVLKLFENWNVMNASFNKIHTCTSCYCRPENVSANKASRSFHRWGKRARVNP